MQLCRIIYYSIVLLYMFRAISLIIRSILTVIDIIGIFINCSWVVTRWQ